MDDYRSIDYDVCELIAHFESPAKYVMKNIDDFLKGYSEHKKETLLHCFGENFYSIRMTPLQYAAYRNHYSIVRYLVTKCNVDVNQIYDPFRSDLGHPGIAHTALGYAVKKGHTETVQVLVECLKADVNLTPSFAPSPLNLALYNRNLELMKYLLDHGANFEECHFNGFVCNASLMVASQGYGEIAEGIVKMFLLKGVDINLADSFGHTPLHIASKEGNISMIKLLINHGAIIKEDKYGLTPLYTACVNQEFQTAEFLLNYLSSNNLLSSEERETFADVLQATILTYSKTRCESEKSFFNSKLAHVSKEITVDQYIENLCGRVRNKSKANSNNSDWSINDSIQVYNRKFGENNPYTALLLVHQINEQNEDVLIHVEQVLRLLQKLQEPNSLMFVWTELALILSQQPNVFEEFQTEYQLFQTVSCCVHYFIEEHVWYKYCFEEWMMNFDHENEEMTASDQNIETILLTLYALIKLIPADNNEVWTQIKDILKVFGTVTNNMLKTGMCSKSPLQVLYSMDSRYVPFELLRTEDIHKMTCLLIKAGVSLHIKDIKGNTILHTLSSLREERCKYHFMCCESLIEYGAHIDSRNTYGRTPYEVYQYTELPCDQDNYTALLTAKSPLSLKCLCSTVLRDFKVQYKFTLPSHLQQYVDSH